MVEAEQVLETTLVVAVLVEEETLEMLEVLILAAAVALMVQAVQV
jgi:hypothetical protein